MLKAPIDENLPWSVEQPFNGTEYHMPWLDKENYHFVKNYVHKCGTCGKRMHQFTLSYQDTLANGFALPCPVCGKKLHCEGLVFWD